MFAFLKLLIYFNFNYHKLYKKLFIICFVHYFLFDFFFSWKVKISLLRLMETVPSLELYIICCQFK